MRRSLTITIIALGVAVVASDAEAKLDLFIDKSVQQIAVLQNGRLLYVWPVSTGLDRFSTPSGVYTPERLERMWFSRAYYNSPMPHAIFFHHGYAIHGSYDITQLGGPASHGCVRLHPQDAAQLFAMVQQEGPANTTIVVGGDRRPGPPAPRYDDPDGQSASPYRSDGPMARGAYVPGPQMAPRYNSNSDRFVDTAGRLRSDPDDQWASPYRSDARGAYMPGPQMAPRYNSNSDRFVDTAGRLRSDPDDQWASPYRSDGRMARGAYVPGPQMAPYYNSNSDRFLDAAGRPRSDGGQF